MAHPFSLDSHEVYKLLLNAQLMHQHRLANIHCRVGDGKNCKCCKIIRLCRIPEATSSPDLWSSVIAILNAIFNKLPTKPLKLDQLHWVFRAQNIHTDWLVVILFNNSGAIGISINFTSSKLWSFWSAPSHLGLSQFKHWIFFESYLVPS